jgi:hypothetical protein
MKLQEHLDTDPIALLSLLREARSKKIMGPWTIDTTPPAPGIWSPGWQRKSVHCNGNAYTGIYGDDLFWGVHITRDDDRGDTVGNREACDAYLRSRGWILIDEPTAADKD